MDTKIFISTDTTSISVGSENVFKQFESYLSGKNPAVSLSKVGSRGLYWLEPLIEIEQNGQRHAFGPLEPEDVPQVLNKDNQINTAFSKYLGLTEELPQLKAQNRFTFSRSGLINPLSFVEYVNHGGLSGLKKALEMGGEKAIEEIHKSGLRGRGGAGFPTGVKMRTVSQCRADKKYVVCNADEGDSGTFADRMVLDSDPFMLIEGMVISGTAVNASKGFIYLRSEYPYSRKIIEEAIQIARRENLLGKNILGKGIEFDIELRIGAGAYICGEETSLLESIEGKPALVRSKPPLPAIKGLFGYPTVINNLLTLASLPGIFQKGSTAYKELGIGRSRGTITMQLTGNVKHGGLYELPFGFPLKKLIFELGGGTYTGRPVKCVQIGGPLGSFIPADQLELGLDYEVFAQAGAMLGHGGIVVFDDRTNIAQIARYSMEFCAGESCGKCTPCRIGSTRGKETIDKMLADNDYQKNKELLLDLCQTMKEGSLCALGGLIPLPVESALKHFEEDFTTIRS